MFSMKVIFSSCLNVLPRHKIKKMVNFQFFDFSTYFNTQSPNDNTHVKTNKKLVIKIWGGTSNETY